MGPLPLIQRPPTRYLPSTVPGRMPEREASGLAGVVAPRAVRRVVTRVCPVGGSQPLRSAMVFLLSDGGNRDYGSASTLMKVLSKPALRAGVAGTTRKKAVRVYVAPAVRPDWRVVVDTETMFWLAASAA